MCLACFLVSRQSKCLKIEELQRYFLTASAHLTTLKKSHFYCYGQCTQHPRQRGEEQAVSVSSPLRVMWVILQKGHYQLCPAVCIILLTSLVFVHLFLPSPLSFIFFSVLSISCCPFSLCSQPCWWGTVNSHHQAEHSYLFFGFELHVSFDTVWYFQWSFNSFFFFTLGCPKPTEDITDPVYLYLSSQWMLMSLKQ